MNLSQIKWKTVGTVAGIAIVVILGIYFIIGSMNNGNTPKNAPNNGAGMQNTSTSTAASTTSSGVMTNSNGTETRPARGAATPTLPSPSITIDLLAPVANSIWTMGSPNVISWNNAADVTGEIDLINANTKAFVGVILSETGPNQTSYSWDARSIYLARYSADKKDVVPGTYAISIRFDGNGLGELISPAVVIVN